MRTRERLVALLLPLCVAACSSSGEKDEAVPGPRPDPSAPSAVPGAPVGATGVIEQPGSQPPSTRPTTTATKPTTTTPDAGVTPDAGTQADAGAKADAGAHADAGAQADAGGGSAGKLKACTDRCQGVLQSCLTPTIPPDGGLPQIKDPAACQKAFQDCQKACAP